MAGSFRVDLKKFLRVLKRVSITRRRASGDITTNSRGGFGELEIGSTTFVHASGEWRGVQSIGGLDGTEINGGEIHLHGWSLSNGAGRMVDAQATVGGERVVDPSVTLGMASPDVAKALAGIPESAACRWAVSARLPQSLSSPVNSYVSLTPVFAKGPGRAFFRPVNLAVPLPREGLIEGVGGGFLAVAYAFLGYFVEYGRLRPDHSVLDIGCGCGRMAYALGPFLEREKGRYRGFDIVAEQVAWASENLTPAFPHLAFEKVDIFNKFYNPKGLIDSSCFVFPYEDRSFDFTFLTSVFTHMLKAGTVHYLREIARTLKPGGTCFATCFLLNRESDELIAKGLSSRIFAYELEGCRIERRKRPEGAVAFREADFLDWCRDAGLEAVSILGGHWCGRAEYVDLQDIVVLRRKR